MLPTKTEKRKEVGRQGAFGRALARYREVKTASRRVTRIGFLIDATASRAETWVQAQSIQRRMIQGTAGIGPMALRLAHFGGFELQVHGWMRSADEIAKAMRKVECETGLTQFVEALWTLLRDGEAPDAIIMVGDCFEESPDELAAVAHALKAAGVKVFCFLEGDDEDATRAFRQLASITGGAFAVFGGPLPLSDLCVGAGLYTAGGKRAVRLLKNEQVKRLLLTGPSSAPGE